MKKVLVTLFISSFPLFIMAAENARTNEVNIENFEVSLIQDSKVNLKDMPESYYVLCIQNACRKVSSYSAHFVNYKNEFSFGVFSINHDNFMKIRLIIGSESKRVRNFPTYGDNCDFKFCKSQDIELKFEKTQNAPSESHELCDLQVIMCGRRMGR